MIAEMTMRFSMLLVFALAAVPGCLARSFDVISTDTGGIEVVLVPIHHGSLMLQFKGKAIYIDPDGQGVTADLPKADFVFFTNGAKNEPGTYDRIRKPSTEVVAGPWSAKRVFGEIAVEPVGGGLVFTMAGRRFYFSGGAPGTSVPHADAAFICMSAACAKDPAAAVNGSGAKVVFPYRFGARDLRSLESTELTEVRLRHWQ